MYIYIYIYMYVYTYICPHDPMNRFKIFKGPPLNICPLGAIT